MSSMSPMSMDGEYLFQVNVSEYYNSQNPDPNGAVLRLTTLYKDTAECDGKLKIQTCDLHGGIAKFPVEVNKNKVKLRGTWKDDEFIQRKSVTIPPQKVNKKERTLLTRCFPGKCSLRGLNRISMEETS